jgi:hypothetical protein
MPDDGMGVYLPLLPRIVLRAITGAGHIIPEETPEEVNPALLALLRTAEASSAEERHQSGAAVQQGILQVDE